MTALSVVVATDTPSRSTSYRPTATLSDEMLQVNVTFAEALQQGLRVADAAAFSLCMENGLPMLVFGAQGDDTIIRAVSGEKIGTLITA